MIYHSLLEPLPDSHTLAQTHGIPHCRQTHSTSSSEERSGDGATFDKSGNVAERDGSTLRLKEGGGSLYAPSPITSVAVHWPKLVAGAQSGELYHVEVEE